MKPVDQTTFGFPGGNCFSACVASLLEIPIEDVPYFMGDTPEGDDGWFDKFLAWPKPYGFWAICVALDADMRKLVEQVGGYYILSGSTERGRRWLHSVVAQGDRIVHDPHPDRSGLLARSDVTVLIPIDPAVRS